MDAGFPEPLTLPFNVVSNIEPALFFSTACGVGGMCDLSLTQAVFFNLSIGYSKFPTPLFSRSGWAELGVLLFAYREGGCFRVRFSPELHQCYL